MKTVDLVATPPTMEALLDLASEDSVLIRMPNGKAFLITEIGETPEDDDFADEVARTRRNQALMTLLAERSKESGKYSLDQVRARFSW